LILRTLFRYGLIYNTAKILCNVFSKYILNFFKRNINYFDVRENSVLLIEFLNVHGEVIPGYIKYLLDLNFNVDVVVQYKKNKGRNDSGLFFPFDSNSKVRIKEMREIDMNYLLRSKIALNYKYILISSYYSKFEFKQLSFVNLKKLKPVCVIHNPDLLSKYYKTNKIISLVAMESKYRTPTVAVNPHYFCDYANRIKKREYSDTVTFITLNTNDLFRRNINLLFDACGFLYEKGVKNFIVKVIGKGLPIPECFKENILDLGFLDFQSMYKEIINSDFFLALIDQKSVQYTKKASGSYQISYGFLKPLVLHSQFSDVSFLTNENSILYNDNNELSNSMERCINMSDSEYMSIINSLKKTQNDIYNFSLNNLKYVLELPLGKL